MILDFQDAVLMGNVITFPEWIYPELPRQGPAREVVVTPGTAGTTTGVNITLYGQADDPGQ